jgi:glutaredoxin
MIKIIGQNGCSRCAMTKILLTNKGINFTYALLEELPKEEKGKYVKEAQEKGLMNLPLIVKNDVIVDLKEVM